MDFAQMFQTGQGAVPDMALRNMQQQQMALQQAQVQQQQMQEQRLTAQAQQEQQRASQYDMAMQDYLADPKPEKLIGMMAQFPEHSEALKRSTEAMDARQRDGEVRQTVELYSYAKNGRFDLAAKSLKERIAAEEAAGVADPNDKEILAMLENPATQNEALGMIEMAVAAANPDKFAETYGKLNPAEKTSPWLREYNDKVSVYGKEKADAMEEFDRIKIGPAGGVVVTPENLSAFLNGSAPQATPQTGGGGQASSGGSRGERNNNPGNLEASAWTKRQPGFKGSDGRFAIFDTPENGRKAQERLLTNSYLSKGHNTPAKVINRYGNDPGPKDDVSVQNYIAYVAKRLGVGPNDIIPPGKAGLLAAAMREFETGNTKSSKPKKVTSKAHYDSLPSGTEYVAPDGSRRRKP